MHCKHYLHYSDHVPGTENVTAEILSRASTTIHKWELNNKFLQPVFRALPDIDVFANRCNVKCEQFCTRGGKNSLSKGDGLLLNWSGRSLYTFPLGP